MWIDFISELGDETYGQTEPSQKEVFIVVLIELFIKLLSTGLRTFKEPHNSENPCLNILSCNGP